MKTRQEWYGDNRDNHDLKNGFEYLVRFCKEKTTPGEYYRGDLPAGDRTNWHQIDWMLNRVKNEKLPREQMYRWFGWLSGVMEAAKLITSAEVNGIIGYYLHE